MPGWTFIIHVFVCYANSQTVRNECCLAERNSAHVLVSTGISRLLDTCLSGIHNANYIVNSIVCAVILVRGSRVPSYGIRPTHGPIHVLDMHGTGTKHIVHHSRRSGVQWSVISEFTCIYVWIRMQMNCHFRLVTIDRTFYLSSRSPLSTSRTIR